MSERTEVGARIRDLRLSAGLSAVKLADEIGVSRVRISKIETGIARNLSLEEARRLAVVFGISIDQLADRATPAPALLIAQEITSARARLDAALASGAS